MIKDKIINALRKKYEADMEAALATIDIYLANSVGIGEHPQFAIEIDKQLEIIGCATDKLRVIEKHYPSDDDIPF